MTIYAPNSTINFENSARIKGALAAKSILLQNSVEITYDERVTDITAHEHRAPVPARHRVPGVHRALRPAWRRIPAAERPP